MKTLLQNKVKFLMLIFLGLFLSAYSGPIDRPGGAKKEYKQEYRSLKGVCNCYKDRHYKNTSKYRKYQKRVNRLRW